jgi:hypothetical protein
MRAGGTTPGAVETQTRLPLKSFDIISLCRFLIELSTAYTRYHGKWYWDTRNGRFGNCKLRVGGRWPGGRERRPSLTALSA